MSAVEIIVSDALEGLKALPEKSVQTCVTSPPYFGLRDYGTAKWEGGSAECDHKGAPLASNKSTLAGYTSENCKIRTHSSPFGQACGKCGAVRHDRQIGLEKTPAEFIEKLVAVFREVRRVLKDDATCWINIGDSYNGSGKGGNPEGSPFTKQKTNAGSLLDNPTRIEGCKPKDLIGIPWMLAFALRNDGWYLRSDIIWAKPNPMPESVTDRPTKSHEYLFLLSKSAKYFYDADAIAETASEDSGFAKQRARGIDTWQYGRTAGGNTTNGVGGTFGTPSSRNKRSVWTVTTQPFSEAHFATFPPKLIEPCILAGSKAGDTVLDPFNGAGTTGLVSNRLGRNYIGLELNPEYAEMSRKRITNDAPLFAGSAA